MSHHGRLKTSGSTEHHRRETRLASGDGWRLKQRTHDPSIEHRPHYFAPSQSLPNSDGANRQRRSISKTTTLRRRSPHIDHARRLLGPIEATNGPETRTQAQPPRGRAMLRLTVMGAVATALILIPNGLQQRSNNEGRLDIPSQHATRLAREAIEPSSFVKPGLVVPSNKTAVAKIAADELAAEHDAIVGPVNLDEPGFKSTDIDMEAVTSLDEQAGIAGAFPSSRQQFKHAETLPNELVATIAQGGPKIALPAVASSMPNRNVTAPNFRVQVAAARNEADAQRAWARSQTDLGMILAGLKPYFERAETSNGIFYRIQTGPFQTRSEAVQICARLRERDVTCFVVIH